MSTTEEEVDRQLQEIDLIRRRHRIYSGIVGKDLDLLPTAPPGRTDCESYIAVPFEDPQAGLVHRHEWQHVLFKSDLRARTAFVEDYLNRIDLQRPGIFTPTHGPRHGDLNRAEVADFLHAFINGLDDLRVCSLWEDPYPQSAEDIQNRWRRLLLSSKKYDKDITMYMMALGLGLRHDSGQLGGSYWRRYEKILTDGTEKVKKSTFAACLIAARWILDSIIDDMWNLSKMGAESYKLPIPEPAKSLSTGAPSPSFSSGFGKPSVHRTEEDQPKLHRSDNPIPVDSALSKFVQGHAVATRADPNGNGPLMDTKDVPKGPDPNYKHTRQVVDAAMGVSTEAQVQILLAQAQVEIEKVIATLKGRTKQLTQDQKLLKGLEGYVSFFDVKPEDVDELRLQPEDGRAIQVLHQEFSRLRGRKRLQMGDSGSVLNPQAYIDFMTGSGDADIFEEEITSKGFSALILIDMSGSMLDDWESVSRACKVLAKALKFPFASLDVWGFSSDRHGKINIMRFLDVEKGYSGEKLKTKAWGLTPLHLTSKVAIRRLAERPSTSKHLFIITDGVPVHLSALGHGATIEDMITEMAFFIEQGRKKKIHTTGLVIGYEVEDNIADVMFGHRRFWHRVDSERGELFHSLVTLVRQSFVNYLRGN
jgi:hypothetical protein